MTREDEIVERLKGLLSSKIGDDAAVVGDDVVTTDMLVENIDFTRATPLKFIARKSLAVNLSDLAAMGARPRYAVVALGMKREDAETIDPFFVALRDAAAEWGVEIVGGDLSRAESLVISITAVGSLGGKPLLRSGAKAGDRIYVSRPIGGSAAGLALLQRGWSIGPAGDIASPQHFGYAIREFGASAVRRHVDPDPELDLGMALVRSGAVTACIDISDGLSTDLHRLCRASGVGAQIERERLPIFPDLLGSAPALGLRAQDAVLHGGEEYALLFTSPLRESEMSSRVGRPVYAIGRVTKDAGVVLLEDGAPRPLEAKGFDHFATA